MIPNTLPTQQKYIWIEKKKHTGTQTHFTSPISYALAFSDPVLGIFEVMWDHLDREWKNKVILSADVTDSWTIITEH